jgi:hypothetical protein
MRGDERDVRTEVDARIDAALRSYAEPEDVPETRVAVARVMAQVRLEPVRGMGWWAWGVAAAACLVLAVGVGEWMLRAPRRPDIAWVPKAPGVVAGNGASAGAKAPTSSSAFTARLKSCPDTTPCSPESWHSLTKSGPRTDGATRALPKLDVFPTPKPLTAEEQALVAFATRTPVEAKVQVVEAERHLGDPIVIAALKIAPLESGVVQDSKESETDKEK